MKNVEPVATPEGHGRLLDRGIAHVLFGVAARNVVLGVFALLGIGVVVLGVAIFHY